MFLLSSTPTSKIPPDVFRKAVIVFRMEVSIFLSTWFVWRFVLKVDLNSIFGVSPILIISCVIFFGSKLFLFGPRSIVLFSNMSVRK